MRPTIALLALAVSTTAACASSSYQTAKMLNPGGTSVTAALSNYSGYSDGDNTGENGFEAMGSYGMSDKLELGGKVSYLNTDDAVYTLLFVPKYSLVADEIALTAPTGIIIPTTDGSNNAYETLPGIIYTRQLNSDFELDLAGQALIMVNDSFDDSDFYAGANVGVALSPGGAPWALHPELGLLIPFGDARGTGTDKLDYYIQFGFAFSYRFGEAPAQAAPASPPPG